MSNDKKKPAKTAEPKKVEPKLKKIKTGVKAGGSVDPCNNFIKQRQ